MEILRKNLLSTIVACREEGSRAAESKVSTDLDKLGDELGDILFQAYAQPPGG